MPATAPRLKMPIEPSLNYESSAGTTHLHVSDSLPPDVVQCLQNARFLHLATCTNLHPHVSLMNYTYLPSSPYSSYPSIIMTTNPSSKKTLNLIENPNVSLLVHDWVSHRPPTTNSLTAGATSPQSPSSPPSSLASLLQNLNTSALSSISSTINGLARLVPQGTAEEVFYKKRHLENNTFEDAGNGGKDVVGGTEETEQGRGREGGDGGRESYIQDESVRVVVVDIREGRVADWKGGVRDWCLRGIGVEVVNGV